jgi:uncharacterized membrane protein YhiD involved in acid resistance
MPTETVEFLQALLSFEDLSGVFSVTDVVLTLILSFIFTAIIGYVYMITHKGTSYTQSYVHTLVMMGMVVAVIMLIVGSNIARAFSLVGALSIIRFRNAVKETRDVGFIFFAMAVGMACGTRFYSLAAITTIIISLLMLIMYRFDWYQKRMTGQILKVQVKPETDYDHLFDAIFVALTTRADLVSVDSVRSGSLTELVYSVDLKNGVDTQEFLKEIRDKAGKGKRVTMITGYNTTDL